MIIIGHRGARGLAPENTLASFDKAIACKVDYVEFDVRLTRDNQLVIIHDRHTGRIAFVKKYISQHTLAELRQIVTKDSQPLLTLKEALEHLAGRVKLQIEIKSRRTAPHVVAALQPFLASGKYTYQDIIISSFHLTEILATHKLDPELRLAMLYKWLPWRFLIAQRIVPLFGIGIRSSALRPRLIQTVKEHGLLLYTYNGRQPEKVNNLDEARKLAALGVDGICTDRPDVVTRAL